MGAANSTYRAASYNPPRTLRVASAVAGALLIIGGLSGIFNIFNPLGAVISFYNIMFGVLIVLTELRSWPILRTFHKSVDHYFHLLSVPRGKGGFYCFIGLLAFFSTEWNLARVCVLIVSIVGMVHLFHCERCGARSEGQAPADSSGGPAGSVPYTSGGGVPPPPSQPPAEAGFSFANVLKQVVTDSPEVISAGVAAAAANPGAAASLASSAYGGATAGAGTFVAPKPTFTGSDQVSGTIGGGSTSGATSGQMSSV